MTTTLRATVRPGELRVQALAAAPRTAAGAVDLDALVRALAPCDLLESPLDSGWSYVAPHQPERLIDDGHRTRWITRRGTEDLGTDPLSALDAWCAPRGLVPDTPRDPDLPAFTGGLVGAVGYDLARRIERLPTLARDDRRTPHLDLRVAEVVVAVAPSRDRALLLARSLSGPCGWHGLDARLAAVRARIAAPPPPADDPRPTAEPVRTSLPGPAYEAAVRAALAQIAAGNSFQVNLSQRITARWPGGVHGLYRALRSHSTPVHGAALPRTGLASISPETFLAVDRGHVRTRPIKGTRPRATDPLLDAALADDLMTSPKDRAENVMIVDLQRNDLGRICRPGSVRVPELARLEAHPTVWHLVSTVEGRLAPGLGYGDLLRATFPCGSVTGAPKVRSMAIIDALEPVRRGFYCGAIGFLAPGAAGLSVAIRTAVLHHDGTVDHGAGGGVVADSDPRAEHAESLDKAAAFLRAVSATRVVAG